MGRRRQRKRERRAERARDVFASPAPDYYLPADESLLSRFESGADDENPAKARTCGECSEFVEDEMAARGTCLHPGSGILGPWPDTAACTFFSARRRALRVARR